MTAWHDGPFIAIDTETTGVDVTRDRIVEAAWVYVQPGGEPGPAWSAVVRPDDFEIPAAAAVVHGITTSKAMVDGKPAAEVLTELVSAFGGPCPVVMYNARFDLPLIIHEAARHGIAVPDLPLVVDPFVIDKQLDRFRKGKRTLTATAAHYGVDLDEDQAHGALADATAAGAVMHELVRRFPQLEAETLPSLFVAQCRWAEQHRASFVDYRRTQFDPDFDVVAGWPLPAGAAS